MLIKRKYLFGTTILAGVMAVAAPAFAQSQLPGVTVQGQSTQDATDLGEVVITGSRIRRDPTNSPAPIISVSREQLLNTGQNSVIDYLATIPALSNSRVPSDTVDVFAQGVGFLGISSPNLRSLGAGRTLTLVDGRRQVGSVGGSLQVDVDTIPRLLIESTEIVTGGASSVYGADAVSGVLNFILRKDFEGLEIDVNASQINQGGNSNRYNAAVLGGINLLDDRLNLWGFAEYEYSDDIRTEDIDWIGDAWVLVGTDADPVATPYDNQIDALLFNNVRTLARPRWGQTTLANTQQPSPLNDPDIPASPCNTTSATGFLNTNCYAVNPGKTFVYEGNTARLANFGQRIGVNGLSRPLNIGGDGANPNVLTFEERTPQMEAQRYAAGANFAITDNLNLSVDAKYVTEEAYAASQPQFFDFHLNDTPGGAASNPNVIPRWSGLFGDGGLGARNYTMRWSDNAYLPQNVKDAINANRLSNYSAPGATTPGVAQPEVDARLARHSLFGPQRYQQQSRDLMQYTAALNGNFERLSFLKNVNWEISYTYGEVENESEENSVDGQRLALAADAVLDLAGEVNNRPGEVVCRAQLIAKRGGVVRDDLFGLIDGRTADLRGSAQGLAALNQCRPLNIFGEGNQSAEALAYIQDEAGLLVTERNESEQAIAFVSGELWDFWGAGPIGVAVGAEYRREYTEAAGRDDRDDLLTFGLTAPDFPGAEYETEEFFGELSIPLLRDTWLGEYAELSGSYRKFDYTTAGKGDVYGVNFVYRPIRDIGFKTSYNTSFRAPNLSENFSPLGQTFSNGFVDPCATANITATLTSTYTAENRASRIANCTAQAVARGYSATFFDFAGATPGTEDDFVQTVTSPFGLSGGNIALRPETSVSKTFTIVLEPRQIPDFSLVLDYYEIRIDDVISAVSVNQAASLCATFNTACDTIFRRIPLPTLGANPSNVDRSAGFQVGGATAQDAAFIQGAVNFAGIQTRGLDFTANYAFDAEEKFGLAIGSFRYSLRGTWLIEQKEFNNPANPALFTEFASNPNSPRVRFTSTLTWNPTEALSLAWAMDWQSSQDLFRLRDQVNSGNIDNRSIQYYESGNFARHDFSVRYQLRDDVTVRAGVTNAFDAEPPVWLRGGFQDNIDPYGTRFFLGLNYRPF